MFILPFVTVLVVKMLALNTRTCSYKICGKNFCILIEVLYFYWSNGGTIRGTLNFDVDELADRWLYNAVLHSRHIIVHCGCEVSRRFGFVQRFFGFIMNESSEEIMVPGSSATAKSKRNFIQSPIVIVLLLASFGSKLAPGIIDPNLANHVDEVFN